MLTVLLLTVMTRVLVSVRLLCSCQESQLSWAELYRSCWWTGVVTTGAHPVSRPPTHNRQHHTRLANNNNNNNNIHLYPPTSNLQHPTSSLHFLLQPSTIPSPPSPQTNIPVQLEEDDLSLQYLFRCCFCILVLHLPCPQLCHIKTVVLTGVGRRPFWLFIFLTKSQNNLLNW